MKKAVFLCACVCISVFFAHAQNVGLGQTSPKSKLDVNGGVTVGSSYSGVNAAPANGAIIQGQVGIGTPTPNSGAALDITSTTQGLLIPRMATRPSSPAAGLQIFNTSTNCLEIYVGGIWQSVACGCTAAPSAPASISGTFTSLCHPLATPTVYTYLVPSVSGATSYTWTVTGDAGAVIAGQGTNAVSITFSGTTATAISCVANNACGSSSAVSQSLSFNTLTAPVATAATFSSVGTTFTANWSASTGASGYYLDVSTNSSFSSFVTGYNGLDVGNYTTYPVSGITCGTTYYYRVRQYTQCSVSPSSNTITATAHSTGSVSYSTANAGITFPVPCGVSTINFKLWGAGGGAGTGGAGGGGGYVSGTYTIQSGVTSLTIIVGGGGASNYDLGTAAGTAGTAAIGGGGKGRSSGNTNYYFSGSGGGMSAVKNGSTYLLVAGGGGGGGSDYFSTYSYGGPGGSTTVDGGYGGSSTAAGGKAGGGAGAGAAGTGSSTTNTGTAGTAGQGGQGKGGAWTALGTYEYGGGGGYPKGGGGGGGSSSTTGTTVNYVGGGGGGASYATGATGVTGTATAATNVDGTSANPPPNTTDADYIAAGGTAGVGGAQFDPNTFINDAGTAGLVVISW